MTGDFGELKVEFPDFRLSGTAFIGVRVRTTPDYSWRPDSFGEGLGINVNDLSVDFRVTDATQFGNTPFCFRGTIGYVPYNVRLQVRPAPTRDYNQEGFSITGGPGKRHLITYIPHIVPGVNPAWGGLVDILAALVLSPDDDTSNGRGWVAGDWRKQVGVGWSC